ncbi:ribosome small subunit-dependent GTPase A [Bacillus timonensis]|nr:ribosome small subunit-dependent GTPase A [Bacillus timonensis]
MHIEQLGWNQQLSEVFTPYKEQGFSIGRVSLEHKRMYRVLTEKGELLAEISGKFRFESNSREDYPAVGDWVVLSTREEEGKATIHHVLPRFSKFSRKVAGNQTEEQIVATNVNTVFLVNALNNDFNVRRLERYLLMSWESGANPVIILSKADLCEDVEKRVKEVESVALGVPIHVVSVKEQTGLDALQAYFHNETVALLGSSGAGKSTLTNQLLGLEKQVVQEIRTDDDKGKHTTTHRELIVLPTGGVIIDTPGMRELQLWEADSSMSHSFQDIEEIAQHCRFRDCSHSGEPGCAIQTAIESGELDEKRYQSYVKLQKELAYLERKTEIRAQLAEKEKWKKITKSVRHRR